LKSQSAVTASRYVVATLPSLQPMHHPLGEGCEFRHMPMSGQSDEASQRLADRLRDAIGS
jgi:hypothetical protein